MYSFLLNRISNFDLYMYQISRGFQYVFYTFFQLAMVFIVVASIMFLRIVVTLAAYTWAKETNNDVIQSQVL